MNNTGRTHARTDGTKRPPGWGAVSLQTRLPPMSDLKPEQRRNCRPEHRRNGNQKPHPSHKIPRTERSKAHIDDDNIAVELNINFKELAALGETLKKIIICNLV